MVLWPLSAAGPFGVTFRFAWNVDIAQMLFLAFLRWMGALLVGVAGAGGVVVLLGTLLIQLYLGYVPLVGTIAALAGVAVVIRRTQGQRLRAPFTVGCASSHLLPSACRGDVGADRDRPDRRTAKSVGNW